MAGWVRGRQRRPRRARADRLARSSMWARRALSARRTRSSSGSVPSGSTSRSKRAKKADRAGAVRRLRSGVRDQDRWAMARPRRLAAIVGPSSVLAGADGHSCEHSSGSEHDGSDVRTTSDSAASDAGSSDAVTPSLKGRQAPKVLCWPPPLSATPRRVLEGKWADCQPARPHPRRDPEVLCRRRGRQDWSRGAQPSPQRLPHMPMCGRSAGPKRTSGRERRRTRPARSRPMPTFDLVRWRRSLARQW